MCSNNWLIPDKYYFTSKPFQLNLLPPTILLWRNGFHNYQEYKFWKQWNQKPTSFPSGFNYTNIEAQNAFSILEWYPLDITHVCAVSIESIYNSIQKKQFS